MLFRSGVIVQPAPQPKIEFHTLRRHAMRCSQAQDRMQLLETGHRIIAQQRSGTFQRLVGSTFDTTQPVKQFERLVNLIGRLTASQFAYQATNDRFRRSSAETQVDPYLTQRVQQLCLGTLIVDPIEKRWINR